jgi:hypothetical protein
MLEKKVKFNNQYWLVQFMDDHYIQVNKYKADGNIDKDFLWQGCVSGKDLVEKCKNVVLESNKIWRKANEIERLASWDGDLDKCIGDVLILE